jgi:hypothetical protein
MSQRWTVCVGGRTYGPYTAAQMKDFAAEGRLGAHSLVARTEGGPFGPAVRNPDVAFLFQPVQPKATAQKPSVATGEGHRSFGQAEAASGSQPSHYIIVADMKSGSITALEEEIFRIGPTHPVLPQAWILATELPVGAVRNLLVQKLGKLDQLFVANATQDKIAWVNLGMETETRLRRIWARQSELSAA